MVAGLSLSFRGLLRSGRLCEGRLDAFYHAVNEGFALQPTVESPQRTFFRGDRHIASAWVLRLVSVRL